MCSPSTVQLFICVMYEPKSTSHKMSMNVPNVRHRASRYLMWTHITAICCMKGHSKESITNGRNCDHCPVIFKVYLWRFSTLKTLCPSSSYSFEKAGLAALVKLLAFVIDSRNWIWINSLFLIIYKFLLKWIEESLEAFFSYWWHSFLKEIWRIKALN